MLIEVRDNKMFDININLKDKLKKESGFTYSKLNHQFKLIKAYIERQPFKQRPPKKGMERYITHWILKQQVPTT